MSYTYGRRAPEPEELWPLPEETIMWENDHARNLRMDQEVYVVEVWNKEISDWIVLRGASYPYKDDAINAALTYEIECEENGEFYTPLRVQMRRERG